MADTEISDMKGYLLDFWQTSTLYTVLIGGNKTLILHLAVDDFKSNYDLNDIPISGNSPT